MSKIIDLTGMRFGSWTVIGISPIKISPHRDWYCRCDCGVVRTVRGQPLRNGSSTSCGCQSSEKISAQKTRQDTPVHYSRFWSPEERAWHSMRRRTSPRNTGEYKRDYLDRGIDMCERWRNSFEAFLEDMGKIPHPGYTLDRIDNDRGYEPGNCRWADKVMQARNRRRAKRE